MLPAVMENSEVEPWVACIEGQVSYARDVERGLNAAGIDTRLQKPPAKACCGGSCGCGSKIQVVVREADLGRVQEYFRSEWTEALRKEGTLGDGAGLVQLNLPVAEGADPPCPACGTAAPLTDGACSDCGLQLD